MGALTTTRRGVTGGLPVSIQEGLDDRADQRGTLRMLATALDQGYLQPWQISGETFKDLPGKVEQILNDSIADGDRRSANGAAKVLAALGAHNLRLLEVTDKIGRLDAGTATENVRVTRTVGLDDFG